MTTTPLPTRATALTIAGQLIDVPDSHRGGKYVFDAWTGEGGEWYSTETLIDDTYVTVPARQLNWEGWDRDEALEALNQMHDLEGLVDNARRAIDPVGALDIAQRLGVTRAAVDKWRERHDDFPTPRWTIGGRPAWSFSDVAAWVATRKAQ